MKAWGQAVVAFTSAMSTLEPLLSSRKGPSSYHNPSIDEHPDDKQSKT